MEDDDYDIEKIHFPNQNPEGDEVLDDMVLDVDDNDEEMPDISHHPAEPELRQLPPKVHVCRSNRDNKRVDYKSQLKARFAGLNPNATSVKAVVITH